jgi:Fanconi anemia group M protein
LILAPTRPLCNQHSIFLQNHLVADKENIKTITGEDNLLIRREKWKGTVLCATPQITARDISRDIVKIDDFSLIIFDEAHRAVGNYAYCKIGKCVNENSNVRMIGMTASIPHEEHRVKEILLNINLKKIEFRDEKSSDVKPYIHKTEINWIKISLPLFLENIRNNLRKAIFNYVKNLRAAGIKTGSNSAISMNKLLELRSEVESKGNYDIRTELTSAIRLTHAINLLETQTIESFLKFYDRLQNNRGIGIQKMMKDPNVRSAFESARGASILGLEHPKINELKKQLKSIGNNEKAIVFSSYRDSVDDIFRSLSEAGYRVKYLIGKSGKGQRQREQVKTIEDMKNGHIDILVSTQVGEEGLDITQCNLVVFYDNVPSAIRFVQRRGRTGRISRGRIVVLIAKGTKEEAYFWSSRRKINLAKKTASKFGKLNSQIVNPLDKYLRKNENSPIVQVDKRESALTIHGLKELGCQVDETILEVGDFIVSDDIIVERKTSSDFVKSVIDGRLFNQLVAMRNSCKKPLLIIEGEKRRAAGLGSSALYGAFASILSDFQITIFNTANIEETIQFIFHLARREQMERNKRITIRHGKKPISIVEKQKYIISGLPNINSVLADKLLRELRTLANIFNADESQLLNIDGIGKKIAQNIWELSNKEYDIN